MNSTPPLPPFQAVLFDFDGTLVDTMPIHYEAYRRTFAEIDIELTHDDFYDHIGGPGLEVIPRFLRGRTASWSTEEIHRRKKHKLLELLDEVAVPPLPTASLLRLLHGRVPMAVATSGTQVGVDKMLARLGWNGYFNSVVTAEDVQRGKPAPDVFLLAAERLGVAIQDCLIFEDTDDGVTAGRTAGGHVIDVRNLAAPTAKSSRLSAFSSSTAEEAAS